MESVSRTNSGMAPSSILSMIGGAIMVLGGLLALSMMNIWSQGGIPQFGLSGGMMGGWGMVSGMMTSASAMWAVVGIMSGVSAGLGAMLIIGGYLIQKKPESRSSWGVAILIASILGLVTITGFLFIGPIIGIIGGMLALTKGQ